MNIYKSQRIFEAKAHAGVVQDKSVPLGNRRASGEPYRDVDALRLHQESARSIGSRGDQRGSLVPLTTQVSPLIKSEIQRVAKKEAISTSATTAAFLEQAIQGHIDMQYGAMLRPVIEQAIKKELQHTTDRTARLALNAFVAAEQARLLTINLLSLLLGGNTDVLPQLIRDSQKQAWSNLKTSLGEE